MAAEGAKRRVIKRPKNPGPLKWRPYATPQDRAIKLSERIMANCLKRIYDRIRAGERIEVQEMQFALEAYKSTRVTKALRDAVPVNELMAIPTKKLVKFINRPDDAPDNNGEEPKVPSEEKERA